MKKCLAFLACVIGLAAVFRSFVEFCEISSFPESGLRELPRAILSGGNEGALLGFYILTIVVELLVGICLLRAGCILGKWNGGATKTPVN